MAAGFIQAIRLGGRDNPQLVSVLFSRFDQDADGALSEDEAPPFWQQRFRDLDVNQDGLLQREEIEQFFEQRGLGSGGFPDSAVGRSAEDRAAAMISRCDEDNDECLSEAEVPEFTWNGYNSFDADGDGKLNREELTEALKANPGRQGTSQLESLLRSLDRFFTRQDKNGDKVVTEDESFDVSWRLYSPHDTNGDGRLEIEEVRKSLEAEIDKQNE